MGLGNLSLEPVVVILCVVGILTVVGFATGALYFVPAAPMATLEAAPDVAGALGVKLLPEAVAAAALAA